MKSTLFVKITLLLLLIACIHNMSAQNQGVGLTATETVIINELSEHASISYDSAQSLYLSYKLLGLVPQPSAPHKINVPMATSSVAPDMGVANLNFATGDTTNWIIHGNGPRKVVSTQTDGLDTFGLFPSSPPIGKYALRLGGWHPKVEFPTPLFSYQEDTAYNTFTVNAATPILAVQYAFVALNWIHTLPTAANLQIFILTAKGDTVPFSKYIQYESGTTSNFDTTTGVNGHTGILGYQGSSYAPPPGKTFTERPVNYLTWHSVNIDLSAYAGQQLTMVITNAWCAFNVDWAYSYISSYCSPANQIASNAPTCLKTEPSLVGPPGMNSYTWTGPAGFAGSKNDSVHTTIPGTYSLTVTTLGQKFGKDTSLTFTYNLLPPAAPAICIVSADDSSKHNVVVWQNPVYAVLDSILIFRQNTSTGLMQIGSVAAAALSQFADTVGTNYLLLSGNPNLGSYNYSIAFKDTCGSISALSPYHTSLFLTHTPTGTFNWNQYRIQGDSAPVPALIGYALYRDNNSTGNYNLISPSSATLTSYTDPDFASYPNASWKVEASFNTTCTPSTAKLNTPYSIINSNIVTAQEVIATGINNSSNDQEISIYPNPASQLLNITYGNFEGNLTIMNALGQVIYTKQLLNKLNATSRNLGNVISANNNSQSIDVSGFAKGVYFISLQSPYARVVKKVVVE